MPSSSEYGWRRGTVRITSDHVVITDSLRTAAHKFWNGSRFVRGWILFAVVFFAAGLAWPATRLDLFRILLGGVLTLSIILGALRLLPRFTTISNASTIQRADIHCAVIDSGNRIIAPKVVFLFESGEGTKKRVTPMSPVFVDAGDEFERTKEALQSQGVETH